MISGIWVKVISLLLPGCICVRACVSGVTYYGCSWSPLQRSFSRCVRASVMLHRAAASALTANDMFLLLLYSELCLVVPSRWPRMVCLYGLFVYIDPPSRPLCSALIISNVVSPPPHHHSTYHSVFVSRAQVRLLYISLIQCDYFFFYMTNMNKF